MTEDINITRYTCDICKKSVDINRGEDSPVRVLSLPMDYVSETGSFERIIVTRVEACENCTKQMRDDLYKHYEASFVHYGGIQISRRDKEIKE